jgi:hypothetical protein
MANDGRRGAGRDCAHRRATHPHRDEGRATNSSPEAWPLQKTGMSMQQESTFSWLLLPLAGNLFPVHWRERRALSF